MSYSVRGRTELEISSIESGSAKKISFDYRPPRVGEAATVFVSFDGSGTHVSVHEFVEGMEAFLTQVRVSLTHSHSRVTV